MAAGSLIEMIHHRMTTMLRNVLFSILVPTLVIGGWHLQRDHPAPEKWTGARFCQQTAEGFPDWVKNHACLRVLRRPRHSAELPPFVIDDRDGYKVPNQCT